MTTTSEHPYWAVVAQTRAAIPPPKDGEVFITALRPAVNPVCGATVEIAARHIATGSHRLSTPEEIGQFRAEQAQRDKLCREMEALNNDRSALAQLTRELANRLPTQDEKKARNN